MPGPTSPLPVALLEADPDLARAVPQEDLALAHRVLTLPSVRVAAGEWVPPALDELPRGTHGLLVCSGLLIRDVALEARISSELVGPGELVQPWAQPDALLPAAVRWTASVPTTLVVLEERMLSASRRWPGLWLALHERTALHAHRLGVHGAIRQLNRVELRVLALLWHLAERWGRVSSDGIVLPIRLTHEALGRLVGAQRPTVTLAVGELTRQGVLDRRADGTWVLRHGSDALLVPPDGARVAPDAGAVAPVGELAVRSDGAGDDAPVRSLAIDPAPLLAAVDELRESLLGRQSRTSELLLEARDTVTRSAATRAAVTSQREMRARRPRVPSG